MSAFHVRQDGLFHRDDCECFGVVFMCGLFSAVRLGRFLPFRFTRSKKPARLLEDVDVSGGGGDDGSRNISESSYEDTEV